jgi:DNA-binding response OmpR family regulator
MSAKPSILVAEDNQILSDVLRFNLLRAGFQVTIALNGELAAQYLRSEKFDLLLTDYQMPSVNGEELCEIVRNELQLTIPIVMCSAKGLELNTDELKVKYQLAEILYKPFSMREIVAFIEKLLQTAASELVAS